MTVESATYVSALQTGNLSNATNVAEGDDHIELIKSVLLNSLANVSGAVTASHTELNYNDITTLGTAQSSKVITVDGSANCDCSAVTFTDLGTITTADINGGSIDGTVIGANSAAAGTFTTVTAGTSVTTGALSCTGRMGYSTGAGASVTQTTSRTTGVTINAHCGQITLVSAAGSTSWQTFTVTNSEMEGNDNVVVNQESGTDKYMIHVTGKTNGSFDITFATTAGTTTEQPVFGFAIIHSVVS